MSEVESHFLAYVPRPARNWTLDPERRHLALDASLVFADLSGFTGLTERLATTGRRGAEEMSTIIADTFDRMLGAAYRAGGSLLKFGGDALLLLFEGPGHQRAAAWAAWEMRIMLRRISRPVTSVGRIRLGMSSSVASGTVHLFMSGVSQRELIIGGETVAELLALEQAAERGTTLVSSRCASHLPPSVLAAQNDRALRLTRRPPQPRLSQVDAQDAPVGDLAPFVPRAVRHRYTAGDTTPQHRRVAVGFIGFEGLDEMIERDPRAASEALDQLVTSIDDIARARDTWLLASDVAPDGGKLIVVAGAPLTTGHDEAALLLTLSEVAHLDTPFLLRIGAHHGSVFFGDIGPIYRRTLTVMGDTVNTAARLMAASSPPAVLASTSMLASRRVPFAAASTRTISLRGRRQPLQVTDLAGPQRDESVPTKTRLVGRDGELARFRELIDAAVNGRGSVLEVVGPPGSGRSRLVAEALATESSITSIRAEATLHEQNVPYAVLRHLFENATGISLQRPDAAERLRRRLVRSDLQEPTSDLAVLARPLGLTGVDESEVSDIDPRYVPALTRQAIARMTMALAPTPLLIAIDDAHFADAASWDAIRHVARIGLRRGWIVVATSDGVGSVDWGDIEVELMELRPLDAETLTTIAAELTDEAPLSTHDLADLVRRSDGNPLLLSEMIAARHHHLDTSAIPDAVESITALHIDALDPSRRRQLEVASVLGTVFDPSLYEWVTGEDAAALLQVDDDLIQVASDNRLRFRNPLTRDVVYDRLPFSHRKEIHHRVAERLAEENASPDQRAFHLYRAEQWEDAGIAAVEAAQEASRSFAHVSAVHWFETALQCIRRTPPDDRVITDISEMLASARERAGEYVGASNAFAEAARLAVEPDRKARILVGRGRMLEKVGSYRHALSCLTRARTLAPSADDVTSAALAHHAGIRFNQGRHSEALKLATRAVDTPDAPSTRPHRALALMVMDMARSALGRDLDGEASRAALRLFQEIGDLGGQARVMNNLGLFSFYRSDWNEAARLYDESRRIFTEIGDEVNASYGAGNLAEIWAAQGRYEEAESLFRDVRRVWRAADDRYGAAFIEAQLGMVAAAKGAVDEAEQRLERAMTEFEGIGARAEVEVAASQLAEAALLAGRPSRARQVIDDHDLELAAHEGRNQSFVARLLAVAGWQEQAPGWQQQVIDSLHAIRAAGDDFHELRLLELLARVDPSSDDVRRMELTTRLGVIVSPVFPFPAPSSAD